MKQVLILLITLPVFGVFDSNLDNITKALSNGDAESLGQYFDSYVEISVLDNEDIYDKPDAINVVQEFFQTEQPKGFSQVHNGTSKGQDSQYCIGNLNTASNTYRVYIFMSVNEGQVRIKELRIDSQ